MIKQRLIALFAYFLFWQSPELALAKTKDPVVARVGTKKILQSEFEQVYRQVIQNASSPPPRRDFLNDLIRYQLGLLEARHRKVQDLPEVKRRVEQVLYKGLLETELSSEIQKIQIVEGDLRKHYRENPEARLERISFSKQNSESIEEWQRRAQNVRQDWQAGKKSFAEWEKIFLNDPVTEAKSLGWQKRSTSSPAAYNALKDTAVGTVSQPFRDGQQIHLLKVSEIKAYSEVDPQEVHKQVFDHKRKEIFDRYFSRLRKKYEVRIDEEVFKE